MSNEIKKGRGRPPLTAQEKEERRIANDKKRNIIHKKSGYASQKKYIKNNAGKFHQIRVTIDPKYKDVLYDLVARTGMDSPSKLFLDAIEKVYGIALQEVDKDKE